MNVLIVSDFSIIKDIFRSILKTQPYIESVKLINSTEIRSSILRKNGLKFVYGGHRISDNRLDLIIYDLDSACGCQNLQIRMIEEISQFSLSTNSVNNTLIVASEDALLKLQGRVSFLHEHFIVKPFRFKDVICKVNDIRLSR